MKKFWFIVFIFFTVVLQVSFYIKYLSQIIPDISLLLLILYSMNSRNKEEASIIAIVVGLFQDLLIGRALGVYALGKLLVVYVSGWIGEKDFIQGNTIGVFTILVSANMVYWSIIWILFYIGFQSDINLYRYFQDHLFLQSLILGVLGVFLFSKVKKIVKKRGHLFPYV